MTVTRGEVWYADLDPVRGSEQAGLRPVLVLQNDDINRFTTTVLVVPLTTNLGRASLPSCVRIDAGEGGLPADSVAICHQVRAIDRMRLLERLGAVAATVLSIVESCVMYTFGISNKPSDEA